MPEGPEVKVITDGLNKILKNKYLIDLHFTDNGRYRNKAPNGFKDFKSFTLQKTPKINKIECKGKLNFFVLTHNTHTHTHTHTFWSHRPHKHTHLHFKIHNTNQENYLVINTATSTNITTTTTTTTTTQTTLI